MHKRYIWKRLIKEVDTKEVVVITGPRQVGKTTTLKWLLDNVKSDNKIYFDLENLADRELFEVKDYNSLINELETRGLSTEERIFVALDEIQLLPNLPSIVKYLFDHYDIKFFLSGSSSYYIKNKFTESMAGRKVVYEMLPLSFQEFLDFNNVDYFLPDLVDSIDNNFSNSTYQKLSSYYQEYIEYGGLPQVVLTNNKLRKKRLLQEIFSSYINLDVKTLADFKSTKDLRDVIKLLAVRIGSKLNISEIANITGLSRITVGSYIEFLEQTYLIKTVAVYSKSIGVKTRMQKKAYFVDTGIANINADLSSGSKFENMVHHQLYPLGKLSYFDNKYGEVDFILENENEKIAFEVKETPMQLDHKKLSKKSEKLGLKKFRVIGKNFSAKFDEFLWGGIIK